jgi:hypothetical protein
MPPFPAAAPLTPHRQLESDSVGGWLGLALRRDPLALPATALTRAVNLDLAAHPGVARRRAGSQTLLSGLDGRVRALAHYAGRRYQVAGTTLYRDGIEILAGLHRNERTTLQPFQPLNDPRTWIYIADHSGMRKVRADGTGVVQRWGMVPPLAPPTLATVAGSPPLTGAYRVVYTYARLDGRTLTQESNPSPESLTVTASGQQLRAGVIASSDPQVTHIRLYRTIAGGSTPLFERQVGNATQDVVLAEPDTGLGAAVSFDHQPPPVCAWVCEHQGHLFLCDDLAHPDYLWWSARWQPDYFPTTNFVRLSTPADPIQGAFALAGHLGVFTRQSKFRVLGNATSGFVPQEALSSRGTPAPFAAGVSEYGCHFLAYDGWFLTDFLSADQILSSDLAPLFDPDSARDLPRLHGYQPVNWAAIATARSVYDKGRLYTALPTGTREVPDLVAVYGRETQAWSTYALDITALLAEEDPDQLTFGTPAGDVRVLQGAGDSGLDVPLDLVSATRGGASPALRKQFYFVVTDIDTQGEPVTLELYIDERLRATLSVTGERSRRRLRLPDRLQGYTWHVRCTSRGVKPVALYGVMVLYQPLAML